MKTRWMTGAMACFLAVTALAAPPKKERPEFVPISDDPNLPRVLLIGDSISIGYTLPTREMLAGKANVHRILTNGGPTSNGVKNIDKWLGDSKWDVIHFNFGLHDIKIMKDGKQQVSIEDYEKNLQQLVKRLKETGATLIWATTTPVPQADQKIARNYADGIAYNKVAEKVMKENGVEIDDLYAFANPQIEQIQLPANVHFTPKGSKILATQVTKTIEQALAERQKTDAKEPAGQSAPAPSN